MANIGLSKEQQAGVVEILNRLLADEFLLYTKTRNYHWNVRGPRFAMLHEFFEEQYKKLEGIIDEVAENARQFGGLAAGTMTEFLQLTQLQEKPGDRPDEDGMIRSLLSDHEAIIRRLREDIPRAGDDCQAVDAADFLTALLEDHDKMAWMLRSHVV